MLAKIDEILIISTPRDIHIFDDLFGSGQQLGMKFTYKIQEFPKGLAEAFIIGEDFIGQDSCALVLGDNIFYGRGFSNTLKNAVNLVETKKRAVIFGYHVKDPSAYGVVEYDMNNEVVSIEEKPQNPKSHYAVPGLYFYDNTVVEIAKSIKPSNRGEIEITAVNNAYLEQKKLTVEILGRGMAWLDTGTYDGLLEASNFIATIQKRQGMYVSCIEEIAYANHWIDRNQLLALSGKYKTDYGDYLRYIANN
jgi:glucose-1-phosphate thymidylyltransferase